MKLSTNIALSFSGGVDSLCILFSLFDMGVKPHLYTYSVFGYPSRDLQYSKAIAKRFNLELTVCQIPSGISTLKKDVVDMLSFGVKGKVNIQCMHGNFYIAQAVKEAQILNGSGIDGLYGTYRTFVFDGSQKNKAIFDKKRVEYYNDPYADAIEYLRNSFAHKNITALFPYHNKEIFDYLLQFSWSQINKPKNKTIIIKEYSEYFNIKRLYRPRGSQQIEAGIRELHDTLLTSDWNTNNRKRVNELYEDIRSEKCLKKMN